MKMKTVGLLGIILFAGMWGAVTHAEGHRIGAGVHYWRTLDRIKDDDYKLDDNGIAWLITYQTPAVALLRLQADVELFPSGFGGFDKTTYAPQVYLVVGSGLYAAGGMGITVSGGHVGDNPFYALRAGLNMTLLPGLHLDIHTQYRFIDWNDVKHLKEKISTDTLTLGVAVRLGF